MRPSLTIKLLSVIIMDMKNARMLSSFQLKLLALITMAIDHVGAFLYKKDGPISRDVYDVLRGIGRVSFPIFCFLLIEGYFHTKSRAKYLARLSIFALISQVPYNLASGRSATSLFKMNIFFMLAVGFACVWLLDYSLNYYKSNKKALPFCLLPSLLLIYWLVVEGGAMRLRLDYNVYGVLLILVFYFFREQEEHFDDDRYRFAILIVRFIAIFYITDRYEDKSQIYCLFALLPVTVYNGEKGRSMKWFFYAFYPAHLLVLFAIKKFMYA